MMQSRPRSATARSTAGNWLDPAPIRTPPPASGAPGAARRVAIQRAAYRGSPSRTAFRTRSSRSASGSDARPARGDARASRRQNREPRRELHQARGAPRRRALRRGPDRLEFPGPDAPMACRRSASTSRTRRRILSLSVSARFTAVSVLPSRGNALVTISVLSPRSIWRRAGRRPGAGIARRLCVAAWSRPACGRPLSIAGDSVAGSSRAAASLRCRRGRISSCGK